LSELTFKSFYEQDLAVISSSALDNKLTSIFRYIFKQYKEADPNLFKDLWVYRGIICPHCLLYIDFTKLSLDCPYCKHTHNYEFNRWGHNFSSVYVRVPLTDLHMLLFSHCINCNGELTLFACPECQKNIDIKCGEYNPADLQGRRNFIARGYVNE